MGLRVEGMGSMSSKCEAEILQAKISQHATPTRVISEGFTPSEDTALSSEHISVKFCGLVCENDARAANECMPQAQFVGFVFYPPSKRAIDAQAAAHLRDILDDSIHTVGVFVDAKHEEIVSLYERGIISVAQLHGHEDEAYIQALRERAPKLAIWKAFVVRDDADLKQANDTSAQLVLLDAGMGQGASFDWSLLLHVTRPYALAGGLNAQLLEAFSWQMKEELLPPPVLVDVSSGIELSGEHGKNAQLMSDFMQAVTRLQQQVRDQQGRDQQGREQQGRAYSTLSPGHRNTKP